MDEGPLDDPEPDEGRADEGRILSPEELDFTESEHVEQLDEGRFVVSSDARTQSPGGSNSQPGSPSQARSGPDAGSQPEPEPQPNSRTDPEPDRSTRQPPATGQREQLSEEAVHRWLQQHFEQNDSRYAFDVTATFDGTVSQRQMASNDVVTIFESLILWYAQQVDSNTPVEDILGILLMESNVPVRYPPESLHELVKSSDLGPNDSIADLLEAIDDGVQL
jgi:hypothetical protein